MRISDWSSDVCSSDLGAQSRAQCKCSKRRRVVEVVDRLPIFRIARADVQPQLLGRVKRQVAEGRPGVRVLMKIDNTGEPRKRNAKRRNIDVRRWVDVELGALIISASLEIDDRANVAGDPEFLAELAVSFDVILV